MKSLSDYVGDKTTQLFNKYGAFYAFGKKQFEEKAVKGVQYCEILGGLVCPKEHAKNLINEFDAIHEQAIKERIEEQGIEKIIQYELANYECWYLGYVSTDAKEVLLDYGATIEQINAIFKKGYGDKSNF